VTGSELADALSASRSRAIAALGKAYVLRADEPDDALFYGLMHGMGLDDDRAIEFLLHTWKVLREQKADAPGEPAPAATKVEPASEAQWKLLRKLADEKGYAAPTAALSKSRASEAIDALQKGTYDPARYDEPF